MIIKLTDYNDGNTVLANTPHIASVRVVRRGITVVEIAGSSYSLWVRQSPDEIYQLIELAQAVNQAQPAAI